MTPTRKPTKPNENLANTGIKAIKTIYKIAIIPIIQSQVSIGNSYRNCIKKHNNPNINRDN